MHIATYLFTLIAQSNNSMKCNETLLKFEIRSPRVTDSVDVRQVFRLMFSLIEGLTFEYATYTGL